MFCEHFKIKDPTTYALRIDPGEVTVTEEVRELQLHQMPDAGPVAAPLHSRPRIPCQNRRALLKDGVVLQLALTPSVQAERYKENIVATEEQVRRKTLTSLGHETLNHDMAAHFVACGGAAVAFPYHS